MANAVKFKQSEVPRQPKEVGRFKVVQGPDLGTTYVMVASRATIGRGDECDVQLTDLKASRVHAEILISNGVCIVKDRGSANGILFNGKVAREGKIKLRDILVLGETTLEYISAEVGTQVLMAPPRTIAQIQASQKNLEAHRAQLKPVGLASLFSRNEKASGSQAASTPGIGSPGTLPSEKRTRFVFAFLAVAALIFFMMPSPTIHNKKNNLNKKNISQNLEEYLPTVATPNRAADTFFKDGFREYINGNFNRARTQFETVLQIVPGHVLAAIYLENCLNAINAEVKNHLDYGKKCYDSGKLHEARGHYATILKLLFKDQSSEKYIQAKENYEKIDHEIRGSDDTVKRDGFSPLKKVGEK